MLTLGTYSPSNFTAPNNPIIIYNVDKVFEYIRFTNNSPSQLSINFGGLIVLLGEFRIKDIPVPEFFQQTLIITPSVNITSVGHGQSNQLTVEGFYLNEVGAPLDAAIPQQAVTTTATGKPIFTANFQTGVTAGGFQTLNVFNPANSGVVCTFHSARAFSNANANPLAQLFQTSGADLNLGIAVTPRSHTATVTPPLSVCHCTAQDGALVSGTNIEIFTLAQSVTQDLLAFPDNTVLYPGNNMSLAIDDGTFPHVIDIVLKWTEDVYVTPIFVQGANAVASSLKNDGNPLGTSIIEVTPTGVGTSTLNVTADGQMTLGVDIAGFVHQFLKASNSGSLLQLGLSSDIVEMISNVLFDQNLRLGATTKIVPSAIAQNVVLDTLQAADSILFENNTVEVARVQSTGWQFKNGKKLLSQSGHTLQDFNFGVANANLTIAVTHGLQANGVATVPTAILITSTVGGNVIFVNTVTTTQFTINSNVAQNVFWLALLA